MAGMPSIIAISPPQFSRSVLARATGDCGGFRLAGARLDGPIGLDASPRTGFSNHMKFSGSRYGHRRET